MKKLNIFRNYWLVSTGEELPSPEINGSWFAQRGLPMIVACSCCGMTMALPSAYIDEDGSCYCSSCAGEDC